MGRRRKTSEYVDQLRAAEDAEWLAVRAAMDSADDAAAERDRLIHSLDEKVEATAAAVVDAIGHMVGEIGVEQSARLLGTTPAKLRKQLRAKPASKPAETPVPAPAPVLSANPYDGVASMPPSDGRQA